MVAKVQSGQLCVGSRINMLPVGRVWIQTRFVESKQPCTRSKTHQSHFETYGHNRDVIVAGDFSHIAPHEITGTAGRDGGGQTDASV